MIPKMEEISSDKKDWKMINEKYGTKPIDINYGTNITKSQL